MKFIMTTNNSWTRVALCALAISSYAQGSETSTAIIKTTGSFIFKIERILSQFFNASNDISYNDCVTALENALNEIESKIKYITDNSNDTFSKKSQEIAQEARKHFNAAYGVIKAYKDRPSDDANKFAADIKRVFSPDTAFAAITTKLRALYKEAEAAKETELMNVIQQLMVVLEKKKAEWSNKGPLTLFTGLTARMCKKK